MTSKSFRQTIPPGDIVNNPIQGSNFWVVLAPVPIEISYDYGEFVLYEQGSGLDSLPAGVQFANLQIKNPSLGSIQVIIYVGGPLYRDARLSVSDARKRLSSWPNTTLGAGASAVFDGITPTGGADSDYLDLKRSYLVIANLDPANGLQVLDAQGVVGGYVFPGTELRVDASEKVTVKNPTASGIACFIHEGWETVPLASL